MNGKAGRPATALWLMAASSVTLFAASAIHGGLVVSLGATSLSDPFPGAAIPEAVIGAVVAAGAVTAFSWWPGARTVALATTLFALVGTLYGMSVTIPRGEAGDIVYHFALLAALVASITLLFRADRRRA